MSTNSKYEQLISVGNEALEMTENNNWKEFENFHYKFFSIFRDSDFSSFSESEDFEVRLLKAELHYAVLVRKAEILKTESQDFRHNLDCFQQSLYSFKEMISVYDIEDHFAEISPKAFGINQQEVMSNYMLDNNLFQMYPSYMVNPYLPQKNYASIVQRLSNAISQSPYSIDKWFGTLYQNHADQDTVKKLKKDVAKNLKSNKKLLQPEKRIGIWALEP